MGRTSRHRAARNSERDFHGETRSNDTHGANSDTIVAQTHAWNDRKKQFTPRQIAVTFDMLRSKGWLVA
jgi:hypothetical protein